MFCQGDTKVLVEYFHPEGKLIIDIEDADSAELHPQQGYVIPRGVVHKTGGRGKTENSLIISGTENGGGAMDGRLVQDDSKNIIALRMVKYEPSLLNKHGTLSRR